MPKTTLTHRIDVALKDAIDAYCQESGRTLQSFVEQTLMEKLEELEDIRDATEASQSDDWVSLDEFSKAIR